MTIKMRQIGYFPWVPSSSVATVMVSVLVGLVSPLASAPLVGYRAGDVAGGRVRGGRGWHVRLGRRGSEGRWNGNSWTTTW